MKPDVQNIMEQKCTADLDGMVSVFSDARRQGRISDLILYWSCCIASHFHFIAYIYLKESALHCAKHDPLKKKHRIVQKGSSKLDAHNRVGTSHV
jgi:hypothetical protein